MVILSSADIIIGGPPYDMTVCYDTRVRSLTLRAALVLRGCPPRVCQQADKSATATVSRTKELFEAAWGQQTVVSSGLKAGCRVIERSDAQRRSGHA